jgi:hypothetical protein
LADFYVPYIQNPEGNNVNIVIGGLQTAVADFDKADFNNQDFNT